MFAWWIFHLWRWTSVCGLSNKLFNSFRFDNWHFPTLIQSACFGQINNCSCHSHLAHHQVGWHHLWILDSAGRPWELHWLHAKIGVEITKQNIFEEQWIMIEFWCFLCFCGGLRRAELTYIRICSLTSFFMWHFMTQVSTRFKLRDVVLPKIHSARV